MCVLWSIWHGGRFLWGQSKGHRAQRGKVSLNWGRLFIISTFIVPLLFRIMITLLILPSPSRLSSLCVLSDERPLQTCILEFCNCAVTSSPPTSNQIDFSSAAPSPHCTHLPFYSPSFHVPPLQKKSSHLSLLQHHPFTDRAIFLSWFHPPSGLLTVSYWDRESASESPGGPNGHRRDDSRLHYVRAEECVLVPAWPGEIGALQPEKNDWMSSKLFL